MNGEIALFWEKLKDKGGSFPPEAFCFVQEGLRYTVDMLHDAQQADPESQRHVSGQELCIGLRDFAIKQYGLLARTVLSSWGINRTQDFGRVVFIMVEAELMKKTDEDSIDDFQGVYDFEEVFSQELELA